MRFLPEGRPEAEWRCFELSEMYDKVKPWEWGEIPEWWIARVQVWAGVRNKVQKVRKDLGLDKT